MAKREILWTDLRPIFDSLLQTFPSPPLFKILAHHEFTQQHTDGFCLVYQLG